MSISPTPHPHGVGFSRAVHFAVTFAVTTGLLFPFSAHAEIASVASRTYNGYQRTRLPDKSFKPETIAFVNAGRWSAPIAGDSVDTLTFEQIIQLLAQPLAARGFLPAKAPQRPDLMIFVAWGTTYGSENFSFTTGFQNAAGDAMNALAAGSNDTAKDDLESAVGNAQSDALESAIVMLNAERRWRDKMNENNAYVLGFQADLQRAYVTDFTTSARDLFEDLSASRYFVVLKAYDFAFAAKEKKRKLLWESRFSIRQQGNDFAEKLPSMINYAARFFGEQTDGAFRRSLPDVKVEIGDAKLIQYEPGKKPPANTPTK